MRESHTLEEIRFSTLARAGEGLTQWRPLLMGFLTLLLAGALIGLGMWSAARMFSAMGAVLGLLLNLVAVVVILAGTSGVGAMLMDRAQNLPVRGYVDAGLFGLMCIPKFLGFGLLVGLAGLAFMLVAAIVYFICKIPVLGAVLAFVAHPLLIVVGAALMVAMVFVVNPLFAPAVWSGLSMKEALVSVVGIASQRLVQVVMMQLVLYVVVGIIGGLLLVGLLPVGLSLTGMAAGIMADSGSISSMMGGFGGGYGRGYGGGYGGGFGGGYGPMGMLSGLMGSSSLIGLGLGLAVLLAVLMALMAQVMMLGLNLVYLQAQENLDTSDTSSRFNRWLATVMERSKAAAQAAKEKARKVKEQADQKALEIKAANEERRLERERQAAEKAEQDRVERERQTEENAKQDALDRQAAEQAERERIERERVEAEKAAAAAAERERQQEAERKAQAEAQRVQEEQARRAAEEEKRLRAEADAKAKAQADAQAAAAAPAKPAPATAAVPSCPGCHSAVGASDAFCGECGHKLK